MSTLVKNWTDWLINSRFAYMNETQKQQTLLWLIDVRDKILRRAKLQPGDTVIDIGSGTGLLAFGTHMLLEGNGKVIVSDAFTDCLDACSRIAEHSGITEGIEFLQADATNINLPDNSVDVVVMRSVLVHILDKSRAIKEFYRILKQNGRISIFEPIIRKNTKYYELVDPATFPDYEKLRDTEVKMFTKDDDPILNFDEVTLEKDFKDAGFKNIDIDISVTSSTYIVKSEMIGPWFDTPPSPGNPTLRQRFREFLQQGEVDELIEDIRTALSDREVTINSPVAYIFAEKA